MFRPTLLRLETLEDRCTPSVLGSSDAGPPRVPENVEFNMATPAGAAHAHAAYDVASGPGASVNRNIEFRTPAGSAGTVDSEDASVDNNPDARGYWEYKITTRAASADVRLPAHVSVGHKPSAILIPGISVKTSVRNVHLSGDIDPLAIPGI